MPKLAERTLHKKYSVKTSLSKLPDLSVGHFVWGRAAGNAGAQ
jgi:hypothetical protein